MVPIDPRIALGVQPLQLPQQDPSAGLNSLARMMQIKSAMQESDVNALRMQEMQRGVDETNKLNSIYGGAVGADGTIDRTKLYGGLASGNLGSKIPGIQKQLLEADTAGATLKKTQAETQKAELETALKKTQHVSSVLSLAQDPQSYATVRAVIKQQFGQDLPEQFDPGVVQAMVAQGQTLTERLAAEHQRLTLAETGRHNLAGETETGRHNKSTEGIQYAQLGETKRHNGVSESHSAQTVAQGAIEYKQDAQGNWIALPKKVGPGPIQSQPVTGPGGQPLPTKNEIGAKNALGIISAAEKLLDDATGSYMGAGVDMAGRLIGKSTKGADTIAQLKALEGALMMAQPRMEGPQSDKDTMLYRQMAAQIGDPTVPADMKKAALQQVKALHQRYAGEQTQQTPPATPAAPKAGGLTPAEQKELDALRARFKK